MNNISDEAGIEHSTQGYISTLYPPLYCDSQVVIDSRGAVSIEAGLYLNLNFQRIDFDSLYGYCLFDMCK